MYEYAEPVSSSAGGLEWPAVCLRTRVEEGVSSVLTAIEVRFTGERALLT